MKVLLLSVGKPKHPAMIALHDEYAGRVSRFRVGYEFRFVPEVRPGSRYTEEHAREREAAALLSAIEAGTVVALDRSGRLLRSEELAERLPRWATPRAHFVLGGPTGLHRSVLERADEVWSLSRLTLPHELARVLVAEQIYRAVTIHRGVPYHK